MSLPVSAKAALLQVAPPNLPLAPKEYETRYHDQLNNVLRLYFNQTNNLIGQLEVPTNCTVAQLPNAGTAGAGSRRFVTDATGPTFGATVVGGGSVNVPVYSDGTNWKVG